MKTPTDELSQVLARDLLDLGAVSLSPQNPFTWSSGLRSPVYCDNRITLGHPTIRARITDGFVDLIASKNLGCDIIGGIATAGIPHAAWLAHHMKKPMIYVRSEAKSHGRQNRIEGPLETDSDVVLIEDLVSTGQSSAAAIPPVSEGGGRVSAVLAIFTYGLEQARKTFEEAGIPLYTLTDYPTLVEVANRSGRIDDADARSLRRWYEDPEAWSSERLI
ncbi:MAG: orotate phosphoribosyltransferase [Rhodothermia bacterium]|nr:MAG: orotate phosphoribosyltransferase [Rhodothermia bacterium]